MKKRYVSLPERFLPLVLVIGVAGCASNSTCVPWPRMSQVDAEGRKIFPSGWKDVAFPTYDETAKAYRSTLPRLKTVDEVNAMLAKSRFPSIEDACRFGDEAEHWRDTCPRPDHFLVPEGRYPEPLGMAYAWLICDSARGLGMTKEVPKASP